MNFTRLIINIVLITCLFITCSSCLSVNNKEKNQPNIIFILADDFGRELLSVYGGSSYQTPVLDRLSNQGLTFTNTYATPLCAPSRMMLLTGQYNFRNYSNWDEMNFSFKTIADYMQDAGYTTGIAGKWHRGGWNLEPKGPKKAGFMHYSSYDYKKFHPNAFWGIDIWQDEERIKLGDYDSSSEHFNNYIINFVKDNKHEPFFFYYAMNLVHRPFLPTPDDEKIDESSIREKITHNRGEAKYFSDNVRYLDKLVGRIIAILEKEELIDNTILIFSGDNGTDNVAEASELYSEFEVRYSSEAKKRRVKGGKYLPTELGVNVPLIVYAPGFIHESRIVKAPVDFTDMLPTLYELGGMSTKDLYTDGISFAPLIYGEEYTSRDWIYSYGNFENNSSKYKDPLNNPDAFYHVISNGQWKYYSSGKFYKINEDRLEENEIPTGHSEESDAAKKRLKDKLEKLRSSQPKLW